MKKIALLIILLGASLAQADTKGMTITAPVTPVQSPFTLTMTGTSSSTIVKTIVYLDGVTYRSVNGGTINISVSASLGKHRVTIQFYDSSGNWTKTTFYVQVVDTTASSPSVKLSWTASASSAVVGYYIFRSSDGGVSYQKLTTSPIPSTSWTDQNVTSGKTYYYAATAVDSNGIQSAFSSPPAKAVIP